MSRIAVVPGSFDPVTLGHLDVIGRAARIFDQLHVLVVHNPDKSALLPIAQRVSLIQDAVRDAKLGDNILVTSWSVGLLVAGEHREPEQMASAAPCIPHANAPFAAL